MTKTPIPKYYKRDRRYADSFRVAWQKRIQNLRLLRQGKLKRTKIQWYYNYGAAIASNNQDFIFSKIYKDEVPTGNFMEWWETDFKQFGIYEKDWDKLTIWQKRFLEAKLQAKNWAKSGYKPGWLATYHPKNFDRIWWDEKPKESRGSSVHPAYVRLIDKEFSKLYK